jgi:transposase
MAALPTGIHILIGNVADMRTRFGGLVVELQAVPEDDHFSAHVFIFRVRRGNVIKVLWSTGDNLCLLAKLLKRGRLVWPEP